VLKDSNAFKVCSSPSGPEPLVEEAAGLPLVSCAETRPKLFTSRRTTQKGLSSSEGRDKEEEEGRLGGGSNAAFLALLESPKADSLGGRYYETPSIGAFYVDATGVGQPVVDEMRSRGLAVTGVYFTHGDRRTAEASEARVTLGKAWLVSRLQALLQGGRLHLPDTSEARSLADELFDYEIRVDENANDKYGAFWVGRHDDLVTALGLAVQVEPWVPLIAQV
jgi:hypothetical protein